MRITASHRFPITAASSALVSWIFQQTDDRTCCDESKRPAKNDDTINTALFGGQCLERQLWKPTLPYPLWDYNWDGRMKPETTMEALVESKGRPVPGTTRHIILIRHGQYDETYEDDEKRTLTDLGRIQAELTGRRLAVMAKGIDEKFGACNIRILRVSDMLRAKETADIIAKHLDGVRRAEPDAMLNEALPAPMIPARPEIDGDREIDENRDRIESTFQTYMHRADIEPKNATCSQEQVHQHEFEIIVGHGNIIRYFVCRALQLPPEAWLRWSVFNCSLTYLIIKPNGYCSCRLMGDIGHLGYENTTFSSGHGFVWA